MWLRSVLEHGGREAQLIFFRLARRSLPLPSLMRMKALYLASTILDVLNPYSKQTKAVIPGMSTSSVVRDCRAVTCCFQPLKANPKHVTALQCLTTEDVDIPGVTAFVCLLYGFKTSRYKAFIRMSDGKGRDLLASLKKINCASLPPCAKTFLTYIKRAQHLARMLMRPVLLVMLVQLTIDGS